MSLGLTRPLSRGIMIPFIALKGTENMVRLLTIDEVAAACGTTRKEVYLWRTRGLGGTRLESIRLGNAVRVSDVELERFLKHQPRDVARCNAHKRRA